MPIKFPEYIKTDRHFIDQHCVLTIMCTSVSFGFTLQSNRDNTDKTAENFSGHLVVLDHEIGGVSN